MEIRKYMEKDIPAMVYIWNKGWKKKDEFWVYGI